MPIYTRTGDKGTTSLFDKTRVLKSHTRVDTYGTVDELNSTIGMAIALCLEITSQEANVKKVIKELEKIQHDLLIVGSTLANPNAGPVTALKKRPADFEKLIDWMTEQMPPLKEFILPGGGRAGAQLHISRTIARRTERQLVALIQEVPVDEAILVYVNRLSDLFFTMARYVNYIEKKKEITWKKK